MYQNYYANNLFSPENFECVEINKNPPPNAKFNNFINGLQNAKNILYSLEKCLKKTQKYENQMLQCRCNHSHTNNNERHFVLSNEKGSCKEECNSARSTADLTESSSSENVVCLKYQYEELSVRYNTLLRAYEDRCKLATTRKKTICRLRKRMKRNHAQLIEANKALLAVGEKYMELRKKKLIEKRWFEERIEQLKQRIEDVVNNAERARLELDDQLKFYPEDNVSLALVLDEVKKCNQLFLENINRNKEEYK